MATAHRCEGERAKATLLRLHADIMQRSRLIPEAQEKLCISEHQTGGNSWVETPMMKHCAEARVFSKSRQKKLPYLHQGTQKYRTSHASSPNLEHLDSLMQSKASHPLIFSVTTHICVSRQYKTTHQAESTSTCASAYSTHAKQTKHLYDDNKTPCNAILSQGLDPPRSPPIATEGACSLMSG